MRPALLLAGLAAALLTSGCAGYRLGPTNDLPPGTQSLEFHPVRNETTEPRLTDAVTQALRRRLQQDGTFRLETRGEGDVVVDCRLVGLRRVGLSYQPGDVITIRDYELLLEARVEARMAASGRVLLDRPVTGRTLMRVGNDLTSVERQVLPLAAEDLARNVVGLLADGDWWRGGDR